MTRSTLPYLNEITDVGKSTLPVSTPFPRVTDPFENYNDSGFVALLAQRLEEQLYLLLNETNGTALEANRDAQVTPVTWELCVGIGLALLANALTGLSMIIKKQSLKHVHVCELAIVVEILNLR